jgi:predicted DCC family thiol-disulfide oxidoreductase YuxK
MRKKQDLFPENYNIVLFDGVCNLCNGAVDFIIKYDRHDQFKLSALQDKVGEKLKKEHLIPATFLDSIILITKNGLLYKSDAALEIASKLGGIWPVFTIFKVFPKSFRDKLYDWIARNRYQWFGSENTCRLPTEAESAKFLKLEDLKEI